MDFGFDLAQWQRGRDIRSGSSHIHVHICCCCYMTHPESFYKTGKAFGDLGERANAVLIMRWPSHMHIHVFSHFISEFRFCSESFLIFFHTHVFSEMANMSRFP